jgi:hypothetical protein
MPSIDALLAKAARQAPRQAPGMDLDALLARAARQAAPAAGVARQAAPAGVARVQAPPAAAKPKGKLRRLHDPKLAPAKGVEVTQVRTQAGGKPFEVDALVLSSTPDLVVHRPIRVYDEVFSSDGFVVTHRWTGAAVAYGPPDAIPQDAIPLIPAVATWLRKGRIDLAERDYEKLSAASRASGLDKGEVERLLQDPRKLPRLVAARQAARAQRRKIVLGQGIGDAQIAAEIRAAIRRDDGLALYGNELAVRIGPFPAFHYRFCWTGKKVVLDPWTPQGWRSGPEPRLGIDQPVIRKPSKVVLDALDEFMSAATAARLRGRKKLAWPVPDAPVGRIRRAKPLDAEQQLRRRASYLHAMDPEAKKPVKPVVVLVEADNRLWVWHGGVVGPGPDKMLYEVVPKAAWKGPTFGYKESGRARSLGLVFCDDAADEAGHEITVRGQSYVHTGRTMLVTAPMISDDMFAEGLLLLKDKRLVMSLGPVQRPRAFSGRLGDVDPARVMAVDLRDPRTVAIAKAKVKGATFAELEAMARPRPIVVQLGDVAEYLHLRTAEEEIKKRAPGFDWQVRQALAALMRKPHEVEEQDRDEDEEEGEE